MKIESPAKLFVAILIIMLAGFWFMGNQTSTASTTKLVPNNTVIEPKDGLTRLTLKEFDAMVQSEQRPTMLFFYASWCPHCRVQMPQMFELEKRRAADVRMLYVSIDSDPEALASFLAKEHGDADFTPYILADGEPQKFAHYLQSRNSSFRGGVPYTALFKPNGQLTHEFLGRAPLSVIEKSFEKQID